MQSEEVGKEVLNGCCSKGEGSKGHLFQAVFAGCRGRADEVSEQTLP